MARSSQARQKATLLAAILANPDETLSRLAFADWLEENSSSPSDAARAEFIRLQCRSAALEEYSPLRLDLEDHAAHLLSEHEPTWWPIKAGIYRRRGTSFNRGFPATIGVEAGQMPQVADYFAARIPLEGLEIWEVQSPVQVLSWSGLDRLRRLTVRWVGGPSTDVAQIAGSPLLGNLRHLDLSGNGLGRQGAQTLAGFSHLNNLVALNLTAAHAGANVVRTLLTSPHFPHLRELSVGTNDIGGGVSMLAGLPELGRLHSLVLYANEINADGARSLARSPHVAGLRVLDVSHNVLIGGAGVSSLARSPQLAGLRCLRLDATGCAPNGAAALARSPHLANLTVLSLSAADMRPAGVAALAASPHFGQLRRLELSYNLIGPEGAVSLARSESLAELRYLGLRQCGIRDAGALALAASPNFPNLTTLNLINNEIGPEGVEALARSPHLATLRHLNLSINSIREGGARALVDSPFLQGLTRLVLDCCRVGKEEKELLREHFGKRVVL
jgi:uncharacterized protein (TIGR02996 family)